MGSVHSSHLETALRGQTSEVQTNRLLVDIGPELLQHLKRITKANGVFIEDKLLDSCARCAMLLPTESSIAIHAPVESTPTTVFGDISDMLDRSAEYTNTHGDKGMICVPMSRWWAQKDATAYIPATHGTEMPIRCVECQTRIKRFDIRCRCHSSIFCSNACKKNANHDCSAVERKAAAILSRFHGYVIGLRFGQLALPFTLHTIILSSLVDCLGLPEDEVAFVILHSMCVLDAIEHRFDLVHDRSRYTLAHTTQNRVANAFRQCYDLKAALAEARRGTN